MKKRYVKNFLQIIFGLLAVVIIWIVLLITCLAYKVETDILLFVSFSFLLPIFFGCLFGGYFVFQTVRFDEKGISIYLFWKRLSLTPWSDITAIEEGYLYNNPIYSIKIANGKELHLDRRKKIKKELDFYKPSIT